MTTPHWLFSLPSPRQSYAHTHHRPAIRWPIGLGAHPQNRPWNSVSTSLGRLVFHRRPTRILHFGTWHPCSCVISDGLWPLFGCGRSRPSTSQPLGTLQLRKPAKLRWKSFRSIALHCSLRQLPGTLQPYWRSVRLTPNPSLHPMCDTRLRPLPPTDELKRQAPT
jgi:hypothetical protein